MASRAHTIVSGSHGLCGNPTERLNKDMCTNTGVWKREFLWHSLVPTVSVGTHIERLKKDMRTNTGVWKRDFLWYITQKQAKSFSPIPVAA